jgi:hypothetical protein
MKEATARRQQFVLEVSPVALFRLFETKKVSIGQTHEAPGGATLRAIPSDWMIEQRGSRVYAAGFDTILVSFASGVALNVFSNWLYDKLKDIEPPLVRKLKINRVEIEITPDGITRAIKEPIESEEK